MILSASAAGIFGSDQCASVAGRQRTICDHVAHRLRQFEQPQRIGNVATALADHLCQIGLGILVIIDKLLISHTFFDRD